MTASRSEQSASQTPSAVSPVFVTTNVAPPASAAPGANNAAATITLAPSFRITVFPLAEVTEIYTHLMNPVNAASTHQ
jgi:hypothetical protein